MATTFVEYTGDGNATKQFSFPSYKESDIKVRVDEVLKSSSTHYNITSYTTTGGGNVVFTSGNIPSSPAKIRIYRDTEVDTAKATFTAGSSVKAADLNNNNTQLLYRAQEEQLPQLIHSYDIDDDAVITAKIKDLNVTTAKLAADAIDGTKIADDAINSEHYADGSIDTAHIANLQVTTGKIAADAVTGAKIADDAIDSEHYAATSIDTEHIANENITTAKLANSAVTSSKLADANVITSKIADDAVTTDKLANSIVSDITANNAKVTNVTTNLTTTTATDSVTVNSSDGTNATIGEATSSAAGVMSTAHHDKLDGIESAATADQTAAEIRTLVESASDSNVFTDADHSKLNAIEASATADQTASEIKTLLQSDKLTASEITTGALDGRYFTETELTGGALDGRYYTETESDARYFNISTGDTIKDGDTFPDNDTTIATTAAINDRIIDLVDDVGGFVPIASETAFPSANPDVNNGSGTLVSIKAIGSTRTPSGGTVTISNGAGSNTVTITGCGSTVLTAGFGVIVETTSTLHTYAFHRLVPKATEVSTVAANATNIAAAGANTTNINTVAGINSNVTTVAGISGNVTTVAGVASNVTTVAGISSDVTAVANDATDIGAVAAKATEIGRLGTADAVADMNTLGTTAIVSDMDTLADISSNITTVANNSSNVTTVAGISSNVTTVAGISSNVTSVANNSSNINSAVSNASNINSAVSNASNINSAVSNASNINTVAGSISNVNTTAGSISNVNTVASNISSVNNFASQYRIGSSNPTSSLDTGDLFFNTTSNSLKVYTGSAWVDGVTATGNFAVITGNTFTGSNRYNDNVKAEFGTSADLEILHNGSDSIINDSGTGSLKLQQGGNTKLEITSSGTSLTGNLVVSGNVDGRDVAADGTKLDGIESGATADQTASEIVALVADQTIAPSIIDMEDNEKIKLGTGDDLEIYHDGTNTKLENATGKFTLKQSNTENFEIKTNNNNGIWLDASGWLLPSVTNTIHLGYSSYRWAKVWGAEADFSGNITVGGTVDGRDVATDGTKLDGIEASATADQTASEIRTLVESASDSNVFTDADHSKLNGIEASADVTDATNVDAAGAVMNSDSTTASMSFVVDEDNMSSNSATKVPTQQSVKAYVDAEVAGVVDSAPGALNTLNELAAALGDDASFSTTVTNSIATKLPLAGGTMTGNIVMSGSQTVDGRDLSVDGAKLDGIASSANNYSHPNHSGEVTSSGDGAMTIADNVVDEANLKVSNSPTNGYFLSAQSGNTGGLTWAQVSTDLVADTSPQLGGDLQSNGNDIDFADNDKAIFGTSGNLEIYSTGSESLIHENATGNLKIKGSNLRLADSSNNLYAFMTSGGAVEMYHNGSKKFETTSSGVSVTGAVYSSTGVVGEDSSNNIDFTTDNRMAIHINGSEEFRFESDGDFHADGDVIAFSTTVSSDERLKENIEIVPDALDKVEALRGVTFDWKRDGKSSAGVIAQEVMGVLPEAVKEVQGLNDKESHLTVNYHALTSILIEAIKDLSAKVKVLEAK